MKILQQTWAMNSYKYSNKKSSSRFLGIKAALKVGSIGSKKYYLVWILFLVVSVLYYFLFITSFFNITEVSSKGLIGVDFSRMNDMFSEKLKGNKIFLMHEKLLEDFINNNAPDYKFVRLSKIYPGKIIIELEKRDASVIVKAANGSFIIDKANFVMGSINSFVGYEVNIEYDKPIEIGKQLEDQSLIASFKYAGSYGVVFVENNTISIRLNNGGRVLLPEDIEESSVESLSITLQKIIQKYTIENKEIDIVDLRFSKQLIKYK